MWPDRLLNLKPPDLESDALPTALRARLEDWRKPNESTSLNKAYLLTLTYKHRRREV